MPLDYVLLFVGRLSAYLNLNFVFIFVKVDVGVGPLHKLSLVEFGLVQVLDGGVDPWSTDLKPEHPLMLEAMQGEAEEVRKLYQLGRFRENDLQLLQMLQTIN
jgi:hypothetical protein